MTRIAVVGAGGYVGGRLVDTLTKRDDTAVVALVRKVRPWLEAAEQVELDLVEPSALITEALDGVDAVIHLAGPSEVQARLRPERVLADTVAISANIGNAAAAADVGRLIYLSTTHVYGARVEPGATLREAMRVEPRHPYAIARLASEHVLAAAGVELVSLRLTNSVGAPADVSVDRWSLVVNDLCRQAATTGTMELLSDGSQWRDFVALSDAVEVIAAIAHGAGRAGTWNLGSGEPATVRSVAGLVADAFGSITGTRPELTAPPPRAELEEPPHVDVSALAADGLECRTPIIDAVSETARFCLEHASDLIRLD